MITAGAAAEEGVVELFPEEEDTDSSDRHQSTITSDNNFALYEVKFVYVLHYN